MKLLLQFIILVYSSCLYGQYKDKIYVAQDGSGDFTTIQQAINETKSFPDIRITIYIKNGVYEEKVKVYAWNSKVTLMGESVEGVVLRWDDHFKKLNVGRNSTFHTATLLVQGDDFRAENLTIENTSGPVGQAVALAVEADRAVFVNCRLIGNQDTLYADGANSRQRFIKCYIEGTTDFIFGGATVIFEGCTIHSKSDSYITAASTPKGRAYGFVFIECKLTASDDVAKVYLGRPWRSYAQTVFIRCDLGGHISPKGWDNWGSSEKEKTVFYAEYGNYGEGAGGQDRVHWANMLSKRKAKKYSAKNVLKAFDIPEMRIE